jgi:MoaE-MoaD fusion protein
MSGHSSLALHFMRIRVLFFGILKDLAGRGSDALSLPERATLGDVLRYYQNAVPKIADVLPSIAMSLNQEYSRPDAELKDGDEVALLPPVSGGGPQDEPLVKLIRTRIVPHEIIPVMERPGDGAIVIFDGVVRDNSRGRRTLYLDYDAYETMATQKLQALAGEARERFAIRNVAIVHRLGRVEIGQSSVLIAVFSAHRAAAFEACRWLIDTLKQTIPIWKKEYFEDGEVWADGELFPAEIPRAEGSHSERPASK